MKNKAICFVYDKKYTKQGNIALNSAKEYNPDYTTVHLTDDKDSSIADIVLHPDDLNLSIYDPNWLIIGRISIIEYVFDGHTICTFSVTSLSANCKIMRLTPSRINSEFLSDTMSHK